MTMNNIDTHIQGAPVEAYRLAVFKQGIKALMLGMQINRGYTSTVCRNFVTERTGVKYPAGKKGLQLALDDLQDLITNY